MAGEREGRGVPFFLPYHVPRPVSFFFRMLTVDGEKRSWMAAQKTFSSRSLANSFGDVDYFYVP